MYMYIQYICIYIYQASHASRARALRDDPVFKLLAWVGSSLAKHVQCVFGTGIFRCKSRYRFLTNIRYMTQRIFG